MSMKPEEIAIGHVYKGRTICARKVIGIVSQTLTYITTLYDQEQIALKDFADWAVADITQEDAK